MASPSGDDVRQSYDIMFFAETDMLPGEDETADVPERYTALPAT
jgi:hypothetical protein